MGNIFCPSCGSPNNEDAKFCMQCGTAIIRAQESCSKCNAILAPNAAFCTNCGTPRATGSQKQVPAPVESTVSSVAEQMAKMQPGDTIVRYGKEFTMQENRMLGRIDERGNSVIDASSFFAVQQEERAASAAQHQHQPSCRVEGHSDHQQPAASEEKVPTQQPLSSTRDAFLRDFDAPIDNMDKEPVPDVQPFTPFESDDWEDEDAFSSDQAKSSPIDFENPDEVESLDPLSYLAGRNGHPIEKPVKGPVQNEPAEDDDELTRFQNLVNQDGYYNDREPIDIDSDFDSHPKIMWGPLILGIAGILLAAIAMYSITNML